MADDPAPAPPPRAPRYLRFVTALVLGTAAVTAAAACELDDKDSPPRPDAAVDAGVVDGPLPPPDLPRVA
jgi:hypothetical protein